MLIHEMTEKGCSDALEQARVGRLACARDNQPYVVPIFFAYHGEHIYGVHRPGRHLYGFTMKESIGASRTSSPSSAALAAGGSSRGDRSEWGSQNDGYESRTMRLSKRPTGRSDCGPTIPQRTSSSDSPSSPSTTGARRSVSSGHYARSTGSWPNSSSTR